MPRFLPIVLITLLLLAGAQSLAQNGFVPAVGDPPVAANIAVSAPNEAGIVTISGTPNAVFPSAQLAIRNLYTEQTVYVQAGLTGTFETRLFGPGNTPFLISPAVEIPARLRDLPGSLPGGPATIVYGNSVLPASPATPITPLIIDGSVTDWEQIGGARFEAADGAVVYGLRNTESLYIALALPRIPTDYWKMGVTYTLEGATYEVLLDPRLVEEAATWKRLTPIENDLGTLAAVKTQAAAIELRIPLEPLRATLGAVLESATLDRLDFLAADNSSLLSISLASDFPAFDEVDGLVYPDGARLADATPFTVSGPVAQGAGVWHAAGRVNQLDFAPGDRLRLQMDVNLSASDLPETLVGLSMVGQLRLQPLVDADGVQAAGGLNSNNGWSTVRTPSGLVVDNLRSDFVLGDVVVPAPQVLRRDDQLIFGLDFDLELPETLPSGRYGLIFQGYGQVGNGNRFQWQDNGLLGIGPGISRLHLTRLPLVLNLGEVATGHLIWGLLMDDPSEGSRGILAREDQSRAALSNRVRFNSPTYILPPFVDPAGEEARRYSLEPYLLAQLPNAYQSTGAPLIPFELPSGDITVKVTRPDGIVENLGRSTIIQNRLSTVALDERDRFGRQSPLDIYRLTTLNPMFSGYQFSQYGAYVIEVQGDLIDIWGNAYAGGGTYDVLVAEQFDMELGVLSGTPFEVGDAFYPGLKVSPGTPADVTVTARIYPLDGSPVIEQEISGQANRYGYFAAAGFTFTVPGEYVIDYEARYTDSLGRLWAGSFRSAGVIAQPDSALIAHGQRGLNDYYPGTRPAWFSTRTYGPDDAPLRLNYPYHSGDVLWYTAGDRNTVRPTITVQDTVGHYADWLVNALGDYRSLDGLSITRRAQRAELPVGVTGGNQPDFNPVLEPVVNEAYTYISVVRPGLTVRQFVVGSDDEGLLLHWDMDDPYNEQIGSGLKGDLVGDYVFMFGGAVARNPEAAIAETAIFGSTGFVTDERDTLGARVYPPYRGNAGGADGGPLLNVLDEPVTMFFHPTGVRPGQVLAIGDTLAIAGQMAPALASDVRVTVTNPAGETQLFTGQANVIGYFYDPAHNLTVDQPGIWKVEIETWHEGLTSAGPIVDAVPMGGVLGVEDRFAVYVVPEDEPALAWNDDRQDFAVPGALPYNFNFAIPEGWVNAQVDHTVTIPGFLLRSGPLNVSGTSFSFQHNPTNLNALFPNVEVDARLDGPAAADPVTLTFVVTGEDADGQPQIRTRIFTLFYDRLITLE